MKSRGGVLSGVVRRSALFTSATVLLLGLAHARVLAADAPTPLGPGRDIEPEPIALGDCPTFHWIPGGEAAGHELVLLAVEVNLDEPDADRPVLRVRLPAGASQWTPPTGWCPQPGETYAWTVRAIGDTHTVLWSAPLLFEMEAAPREALLDIVTALRERMGDRTAEATLRRLLARSTSDQRDGPSSAAAPIDTPDVVVQGPMDVDGPISTASAASAGGPVSLGEDHVGTTAFQDFELRAAGARALLLRPTTGAPNVVGGVPENVLLHADVVGVTISGGGGADTSNFFHHRVTDDYATIGGGRGHVAGDGVSSPSDHAWATVGGGDRNAARFSGSAVGGGSLNSADHSFASVAGGESNAAEGHYSAIGGGNENRTEGEYSAVPGGYGAVARHRQIAYSSHRFFGVDDFGSAQWSLFVLRGETTGATPIELAIDASAALTVRGTTTLEIQVAGTSDTGEAAAYEIEAVVEAGTCSPAFVGTPTITVLGEDDPDWDATISTDVPNLSIDVVVNGAAGDIVRWVATVRAAEVDRGDLGGC